MAQSTEWKDNPWEKIFANYDSIRNRYAEYVNNSYNSVTKCQMIWFFKRAENLNRHFNQEDTQVAKRHLWIHSTPRATGEMQGETTPHSLGRLRSNNRKQVLWGREETVPWWWEWELVQPLEITEPPRGPASPLLGMPEGNAGTPGVHTPISSSISHNSQKIRSNPSTHWWPNGYTCTIFIQLQRVNLEDLMHSEIRQPQSYLLWVYLHKLEKTKFKMGDWAVAVGGGEGDVATGQASFLGRHHAWADTQQAARVSTVMGTH